jgi:hypothetical protein
MIGLRGQKGGVLGERRVATASGALIGESLRVGASLEGVPIVVDKVVRADCGDVAVGQPLTWTFIEFQVAVEEVDAWAAKLSAVLDERQGWYCDFRSPEARCPVDHGQRIMGDPSAYPRLNWTGPNSAERAVIDASTSGIS